MELINIENVKKVYNSGEISVNALRGINLKINEGEFLVIAGESGSGKTTLLNIIGTLDVPTEGTISLNGEEISKKTTEELSELRLNKLGFIFQAYNLIPVLTAMENIEFTMMLKGIPESVRREKALTVMNELGIGELANKRPNEMSGGQQQRVAVARAIVNDPLIVLADEPTANLDSKSGENLLDLMQKMNREKNITFIFSSHDNKVMNRASRLITLTDGLIVSEK
ncbi:MAG: ABC transporter ATP-binding protein [Candidatus Kapabacteria bacterium]|nr:ABC transporter ATP-binding protein [Ignavibacteriota bacterium]MCW5886211.1 ABC transporter ATP-binding protein [Candidatus Kapabacteria bacterium]